MAASRIKGITVEINGSTTGLDKALKSVNGTISQTQSALKDVNRLLKLDPGNAELLTQKQKLLKEAVSETKEKLDALKMASEQAAKTVGNYDAWKKAYTPIQEEIGKTQEKVKTLKEKMAELEKAGKVDTSEYKRLGAELKNEQGYLDDLKKKAKEVSDEFGNPISHEQYDALQREIIETEQRLKSLKSQAKEAASVLGSQMQLAGSKLQEAGSKVTDAGKALMPITTAVAGLGAAAVKTTADFDASMAKVAAVSGATGDDFDRLRIKAREMGRDTKFSASEAADAMNYMAMAGWDTEDMLNSIDGIMNLAAASGEDLASVSDIVTDAMTAFGMSADGTSKVLRDGMVTEVSNATRFVDVLAQASRSSNTNVAMMGETFKYVAPLAGAMGYSAEDTALAIGLMANSGIKGSQAGTSLRSVLTNLAKPTEDLAILMDEMGIALDDGHGNMLPLIDVMEQMRGAFGNLQMSQEDFNAALSDLDAQLAAGSLTEKEYGTEMERLMERAYGAEGALKATAAATVAGKYGMSGMIAIANATEEDFNSLKDSIYNASGATEEMAAIMQDNLSGQLTILKSQLAEAEIAIGDILMPMIRDITSKIQEWVDKFNGLSEEQKKTIVMIGLVVAAGAPLLVMLGTLISSVGIIISAAGGLLTALAGLNPVFLGVTAAVAAVVAIGVTLYKNWDTIKEKAAELGQWVSEKWEGLKTATAEKWEGIKSAVSEKISAAKEKAASVAGDIKTRLSESFNTAKTNVSNAMGNIKTSVSQKLQDARSAASERLDGIRNKFSSAFENTKTTVKNALDKIKGFFNFSWSLPKLKMPHFSISGGFSLNPPSVPHFSIEWYKKAMNKAYVLKGASIFGSMGGKLLGGGEAGSEVVAGTQYMMDLIRESTAQKDQRLLETVRSMESRLVEAVKEYLPMSWQKETENPQIVVEPYVTVEIGNRQFDDYIVRTAEKGISGRQADYRKAKGYVPGMV